ncbi:hypothetical protein [Mycoplasmopsis bovigenitalium]|uniref:hypothetical protein n=1 Tax=Mycoplasmopsis bovigenitalium TaxID=2112 RepID=UPI00187C8993|nr:hypothetical protein [Mycoplasmopsis bovigenitalium]
MKKIPQNNILKIAYDKRRFKLLFEEVCGLLLKVNIVGVNKKSQAHILLLTRYF